MRDVRAVVLVVLAAGCATMATGHWTSAGRLTVPAGGLRSDPPVLYGHRRLLEVAGKATDCVQRCACNLGFMPMLMDASMQWPLADQPTSPRRPVRAQVR